MKKILLFFSLLTLLGTSVFAQSFGSSNLSGESLDNPTCLQFGPDGRLYVTEQDGTIFAYTVVRNGANNYQITATETINIVQNIQNHNDNGNENNGVDERLITGLLVKGTASNPILYIASSDIRNGAGGSGVDKNLDTNSGIISRLTRNGNSWNKVDLIRGLPRSEEIHATNGIQIDDATNTMYIASGGHTNAGSPSNNFTFSTEYALSAAILSVDLNAINAMPILNDAGAAYIYDIPTLDDPTRPNVNGKDVNDPFGGNDGLNQAKIVPGGPVQIYSPGYRNAYDVVLTESGRLYTWDNGPNANWGGHPDKEGTPNVTNNFVPGEPGSSGPGPNDPQVNNLDGLHFITGQGYYGGHPCPIRANPAGAGLFTHDISDGPGGQNGVWRTSVTNNINTTLPVDWPPVPINMANPVEGDYRNPGETDGALWTIDHSTNGIAEYTASNFGGAMKGDLLAASFSNDLFRVNLNNAGTINNDSDVSVLASGFGNNPLDVTAQGDNDPFPGTIWVVTFGADNIRVFEPSDFGNPGSGNGNNIYINAGGPQVTSNGVTWLADQFNLGGNYTFSTNANIAGTTSDVIYKTERSGRPNDPFRYAIPVPPGNYTLQLHFAEIYNGAQDPGDRVFDVVVEGNVLLDNFDIVQEAGYQTALVKTIPVTSSGNFLNIRFDGIADNPKISAIAVLGSGGVTCQGNPGNNIDEDGDGYTNTDELNNGTNPCNAADRPEDFDGTLIGGFMVSNLNDPDDDDDGIPDTADKFALDPNNGLTTNLPIDYPFFNGDPGTGFFGLGFTGLMTNNNTDYLDLIQNDDNSSTEIIAGGAAGLLSFNGVAAGDAIQGVNTQQNAFQYGINTNSNTSPFVVESGLLGPVFTSTPNGNQAAGIFIGNGDQNNYLKFTVYANQGNPGLAVLFESGGSVVSSSNFPFPNIGNQTAIRLRLFVNPSTGNVQPQYAFGNNNFTNLGGAIQLTGSTLSALQSSNNALAAGVISTTFNSNPNFNATWDYLNVTFDNSNGPSPALLTGPSNVTVTGTEIFTVNHTGGSQPIVVQNVTLSGSNNFTYNVFQGTPFTVQPGQSFNVEVSHSGPANQTAQIQIQHTGSNGPVTNFNITSAGGSTFSPDPTKTYYIDAPVHNLRLAASGDAEDAFTTSTNTTGSLVEWKFVAKGNGSWHVQKADGGSKPRLRTRNNGGETDMQPTSSSGTWTYWDLAPSNAINNTYYFTLPDAPGDLRRLQIDNQGDLNMVPTSFSGTWVSLRLIEVESSSSSSDKVVHIRKRNATGFALDGGVGGGNGQNVHLWTQNQNNVNQQWIEMDRGNGFYSYRKQDTDFCLDGGAGGVNKQNVNLNTCNDNNQNQQWQKVNMGGGSVQLRKRSGGLAYTLNGGNGGASGQNISLWNSSNPSQNLHWLISEIEGAEVRAVASDFWVTPLFGQKAKLQWYFLQQEGKKVTQYLVKHSTSEGEEMEEVATIPAEDDNGEISYNFLHQTPKEGINYYQIIVEYEDGTTNSQMVEEVVFEKKIGQIQVAPNPAMDYLNVDVSNYMNKSIDYFIQSVDGVNQLAGRLNSDHDDTIQLDLTNIQNGIYILYAKPENHRAIPIKFMIAKDY